MEKQIHKIVITGGPCAGKTTAMSWIQNELSQRGYTVLFIPETATELKQNGVNPIICNSNYKFQKCLLEIQLQKEKTYAEFAKSVDNDKILIVCDRGTMDGVTYITPAEANRIFGELGVNEVSLRDRYDAVFHLVTTAKGAEEYYTNSNNKVRTETLSEAREADEKLIQVWNGHPHFRVIENKTDFAEKMKTLMAEITGFLGEPKPYEIEKKFLIKYPDIEMLQETYDVKKVDIFQTYLKSEPGEEKRIRQRGTDGIYTFYQTTKYDISDVKRLEVERRLSQEEYLELLMDADTSKRQVRKTRYCMMFHSKYYEIDVYPFWNDKAVMEIELNDENEKIEFPEGIEIIKEVTGDKRYRNAVIVENFGEKK